MLDIKAGQKIVEVLSDIDKIEEEKADSDTEADEKAEEVKEESEEIGKDVDEVEEEAEKEDEGDGAEPYELEENKPEEVEPPLDASEKDNTAEIIKSLADKVNGLEEAVSSLTALKEEMEKYVGMQKEAFGYKSDVRGKKADIDNISAEELKAQILNS